MKRVTIGIPSYNEERNIINLLDSLVTQPSKDIFISEIIISDDSTDRTPELVEKFAKKIIIPNNIIAIDLYLQCKILEFGLNILYDDSALIYFLPANNLFDFASQVVRADIGHKQIHAYYSKFKINLPLKIAVIEGVRNYIHDPIGALCVMICYATLPYYKAKIKEAGSAKWHTADSTKAFDYKVRF